MMNSSEIHHLFERNIHWRSNLETYEERWLEAGLPVQNGQLTSHISSLVGITAAVTIRHLCSIITSESEHPNRNKCPYYDKTHVYSTQAAFIDRNIIEASFSEVVVRDIIRIPSKHRSKTESTLIFDNRLEDHISQHIFPKQLQLTSFFPKSFFSYAATARCLFSDRSIHIYIYIYAFRNSHIYKKY